AVLPTPGIGVWQRPGPSAALDGKQATATQSQHERALGQVRSQSPCPGGQLLGSHPRRSLRRALTFGHSSLSTLYTTESREVPSKDACPRGAELGDGGLRTGVQRIGLDLDPAVPAVFEAVRQEQQLGLGVDLGAPPA